ncbi:MULTISPECIES: TniQ family protein [Streptomyces griseus group]|uniref:TniQ family protein n=1 Tax=Streptomyces griseus group TaxID=629295 RepID=UPI000997B80B|nr:TniQ family protein [Streptomyces cyaneofuscatus]
MNRNEHNPETLTPARRLSIPVRPWGGESLPSYVARLAHANHTPHTALWRHIGVPFRAGASSATLPWEATLNHPAVARLVVMSGIPIERLRKALPALSWATQESSALPTDVPTVWLRQAHSPNATICRQCTLRRGVSAAVRAHLALPDIVCHRHHIWQSPEPWDVAAVPEIERAQRSLRKLRKVHGNHIMACCVRDARWIISGWIPIPSREPKFEDLWQQRRRQLGLPTGFRSYELPAHVMTHPEVVTLAFALVPIYLDPSHYRRDLREWEFKAHLRSRLGLDPRRNPTGDPINKFFYMLQMDRARWRNPKIAMITETATPRTAQ